LDREAGLCERYRELQEQERSCLIARPNEEELRVLAERKRRLLRQIRETEGQRESLVQELGRAWGFAADEVSVSRIADLMPERGLRLRQLGGRLRDAAAGVCAAERANRALVDRMLHHLGTSLRLLETMGGFRLLEKKGRLLSTEG